MWPTAWCRVLSRHTSCCPGPQGAGAPCQHLGVRWCLMLTPRDMTAHTRDTHTAHLRHTHTPNTRTHSHTWRWVCTQLRHTHTHSHTRRRGCTPDKHVHPVLSPATPRPHGDLRVPSPEEVSLEARPCPPLLPPPLPTFDARGHPAPQSLCPGQRFPDSTLGAGTVTWLPPICLRMECSGPQTQL